jgi:hypothetical protein
LINGAPVISKSGIFLNIVTMVSYIKLLRKLLFFRMIPLLLSLFASLTLYNKVVCLYS